MNSASVRHGGYTIIETMIFLIISGALVVGAFALFGGRIGRTQFTQSAQELATRLQTTMSEVAAGQYPPNPVFKCTISGSGVLQTTPVNGVAQGTHTDCTFLGKVINFGSTAYSSSRVDVYTVIGSRLVTTGLNKGHAVTSLAEANPTPVTSPDLTNSFDLGYQTTVKSVRQKDAGGVLSPVSALGLFQGFGGAYGSANNLSSGSQNASGYVITGTGTSWPIKSNDLQNAITTNTYKPVPEGGLVICLQGADRSQVASITVGQGNTGLTTTVLIGDTQC